MTKTQKQHELFWIIDASINYYDLIISKSIKLGQEHMVVEFVWVSDKSQKLYKLQHNCPLMLEMLKKCNLQIKRAWKWERGEN